MYNGSSNYKTGIYAPTRMNKARVTFDISDVTAAGDVSSITVTSESALSNRNHLVDKVRGSKYKLATHEKDRFALDGSWTFPDDTLANNGEIGWVSEVICDATGVFTVPPQFTVNFNADHSSIGLTITFDPTIGEYATDFTMVAYDASNNVLASYPFTGNTQTMVLAQGQLTNYRKVGVIINKWSVPNRRARVTEVDFGIVRVYTGETGLVSMGLTEEMDLTSATIPSPEFEFVVDNSSREFNILNPQGFYKSLQQKQQVLGEIGLAYDDGSVEWIPIGNYQLNEWVSDEGSLTSTFRARTQLDLLSSVEIPERTVPLNQSLYQVAQAIFVSYAGISNYWIDPALNNIFTNTLRKKTNARNFLQMVAQAGCANVYVTRTGVITVKVLPTTATSVDTISMNDQYAEPRILLENPVKALNVSYYTDVNTAVPVTVTGSNTVGDTLKLEGNTLIDTSARATAVGNWLLAQKNNRAVYTANWRGNQAHEQGDVVSIGNSYGVTANAYITKTELKYEGYVAATTEARGVAN